jgi:LysW-gamma-L-lysine carboxypeptidase
MDNNTEVLMKALEIYSPSGKEHALAYYLRGQMTNLGYSVETDNVGNVIGVINDGKPVTLLCGHLDTVHGEIETKIENGMVYGRGAVDAKSPLIALMIAAANYKKNGGKGTVVFSGVVEEEKMSKGSKELIKNPMFEKLRPDYLVFGEPQKVNGIAVGYKGLVDTLFVCESKPGHGAFHSDIVENPVDTILQLIHEINEYLEAENSNAESQTPYNTITKNFMSINTPVIEEGAEFERTTPRQCGLLIDFRLPKWITTYQFTDSIESFVEKINKTKKESSLRLRIVDAVEPYENTDRSIVTAMRKAIVKSGRKPNPTVKTGTCDMNILAGQWSIPAITCGPGDSIMDHTVMEFVPEKDYLDFITIAEEFLRNLETI